jgi:NADH-quinone oxidoreductase subunit G
MYLLQKLMRTLGSGSIDHRLRQSDFSDQDAAPVIPWLGQDIENLENVDAALLIASNTRKEQPLANHRLRKATNNGAQVSFINTRTFDFNFPVAHNIAVAQQKLLYELAAVASAVFADSDEALPSYIAGAAAIATPNDTHRAIASQLSKGENTTVLLGSQAAMHPSFSAIRALAEAIASRTDSHFGYLSDGANSAGAWLAGAVPHRGPCNDGDAVKGLNLLEWSEKGTKAAILVNVEPEHDVANSRQLTRALASANAVVAVTAFRSPALDDLATVMLPAAAFTETSGTFVNAEGVMQSFKGANPAPGEARPAWKILRVLGNLLKLEGFDYLSSEQVRDELRQDCEDIELNNSVAGTAQVSLPAAGGALMRSADVPIYAADALVRRAAALQKTTDAVSLSVTLNPADATRLDLDDDAGSVSVKQGDSSVAMKLIIDDAVPEGSAWIPMAVPGSELLGEPFGEVTVEKG